MLHTLEKGALKLSFHFGFRGHTSEGATLSEMCKGMAAGFQKIEGFKTRLARVMPEFADLQVAVVGVSFPRAKPANGKALAQAWQLDRGFG